MQEDSRLMVASVKQKRRIFLMHKRFSKPTILHAWMRLCDVQHVIYGC